MKKLFLILIALLICSTTVFAETTDNIAILTRKGFFERPTKPCSNPYEEIKRTFDLHYKYSNSYNYDGLKGLYADNYVNADGFNKDIYFSLIKKTWDSYPDIKYKLSIKNIKINDNTAVVDVDEFATATTNGTSSIVQEKGLLESFSESTYYLENINNKWLVTSDTINYEKTYLRYGSAKYTDINLSAPSQILAGTDYTASLKVIPPKDSFIIASIGKENITHPQVVSDEVFRKMPTSGILERMFTSNKKNINEYAVASLGITKAEIKDGKELKIYVTGLGFLMLRVNVIPKNNYIKVENEKTK